MKRNFVRSSLMLLAACLIVTASAVCVSAQTELQSNYTGKTVILQVMNGMKKLQKKSLLLLRSNDLSCEGAINGY